MSIQELAQIMEDLATIENNCPRDAEVFLRGLGSALQKFPTISNRLQGLANDLEDQFWGEDD